MTKALPKIAYLTLAYQPINIRHAIWNAREQSYPDELKILYLMHQHPYPRPLTDLSAIKFPIREFNVEGKWAKLWYLKLKHFCKYVEEPFTVLWDEDDRFEYEYTAKALAPLINGSADATWNYTNDFVTKVGIFKYKHYEPIGTMVIKTNVLQKAVLQVGASNPSFTQSVKGRVGPLDTLLRQYIERNYYVKEHDGIRGFYQHLKSSTKRKNKWEIDA